MWPAHSKVYYRRETHRIAACNNELRKVPSGSIGGETFARGEERKRRRSGRRRAADSRAAGMKSFMHKILEKLMYKSDFAISRWTPTEFTQGVVFYALQARVKPECDKAKLGYRYSMSLAQRGVARVPLLDVVFHCGEMCWQWSGTSYDCGEV